MGIISDAIDALEDWCCDLFKDGIKSQFDSVGVEYFRSKLWVGDYMNIDKPRIVIDRKKA